MFLTHCLAVTLWACATNAAEFYSWDFVTGHFDNVSLVPLGKGAVKLLRPAKDGLHIRLPLGEKVDHVGFSPRFRIHGDFDIQLTYDIRKWQTPESGSGVGPSLYITTDAEQQPAAGLSRVLRPDKKSIHSVFMAMPVDGVRKNRVRFFDTETKTGRLRLKRIGTKLEYAAANGIGGEFQVLDELDFSSADVSLLRVALIQSDPKSTAEVVFLSVLISADELPHLPSKQARTERLYAPRYHPPPRPQSRAWLWQAIVAAFIAVGVAVWLVRRRK